MLTLALNTFPLAVIVLKNYLSKMLLKPIFFVPNIYIKNNKFYNL